MSLSKVIRFCGTWHNADDEAVSHFLDWDELKRVIMQEEKTQTGGLHLQMYFETKTRMRYTDVARMFGISHVNNAKGTAWQNYLYCTKEESATGKFQIQRGEFKEPRTYTRENKVNGLDLMVEAIKEGATINEIARDHPKQFLLHNRGVAELIHHTTTVKETKPISVVLLTGPTGTGKSYWVRQYCAWHEIELYNKQIQGIKDTQWFDGVDGTTALLLDDFDHGQVPFRTLLTWLDTYKLKVQTKGGTTWAKWNYVFITSNRLPQDWYPDQLGGIDPLIRRIHVHHECPRRYAIEYIDYKTELVLNTPREFERKREEPIVEPLVEQIPFPPVIMPEEYMTEEEPNEDWLDPDEWSFDEEL